MHARIVSLLQVYTQDCTIFQSPSRAPWDAIFESLDNATNNIICNKSYGDCDEQYNYYIHVGTNVLDFVIETRALFRPAAKRTNNHIN